MSSWLGWLYSKNENITEKNHVDDLETIEILCDRVANSTLIEDKRSSLNELKLLSSNCKLEVGTRAMDVVMDIMKNFAQDSEVIGYSVDILNNVLQPKNSLSNNEAKINDLSLQFCEIFLKKAENVKILLENMESARFQIKWAILKLILSLAKGQLKRLQIIISEIPFGYSRILELLNEEREMIRNDTILLLMNLSMNDSTIQKILSFENIFEKLFTILQLEGFSDAGIIAHDCIIIMQNILSQNLITQNHFRESGFFSNLSPFFVIASEYLINSVWPTSKITSILAVLTLIRLLLNPLNPSQSLNSSQKAIQQSGLFTHLIRMFSVKSLPENVLIETILTTSEIIRGNRLNRDIFTNYMNEINQGKDVLFSVLMTIINPKNSILLRQSMMYLYECYIFKNDELKERFMNALLPLNEDVTSFPFLGKSLCSGFITDDATLLWVSCKAFMHIIYNSLLAKPDLLRINFLIEDEILKQSSSVSLLSRIMSLIRNENISAISKGHLISFLIVWMMDSEEVATEYLQIPDAITVPITNLVKISINEDIIIQGLYSALISIFLTSDSIISKRQYVEKSIKVHLSIDDLKNKISFLTQHPQFIASSRSPRYDLSANPPFDFEFTGLVKKIEVMLINYSSLNYQQNLLYPLADSVSINLSIKEKDDEIERLKSHCKTLESQIQEITDKISPGIQKSNDNDWFQMYHDLNKDFQKLIQDNQSILSVLESQEEEIKNLNNKLNNLTKNSKIDEIPNDEYKCTLSLPSQPDLRSTPDSIIIVSDDRISSQQNILPTTIPTTNVQIFYSKMTPSNFDNIDCYDTNYANADMLSQSNEEENKSNYNSSSNYYYQNGYYYYYENNQLT